MHLARGRLSVLAGLSGVALGLASAATQALSRPIGEVQGAAHRSPLVGQTVSVDGTVTLVLPNGFFVQGEPDGDEATSDGIFVFTSDAVAVETGDLVIVEGEVVEFVPPRRPTQLPLTELAEPDFAVVEPASALPQPLMLGAGGRMPPSSTIDDDALTVFDPPNDGLDFYESLEGMRVTVPDALALSTVNRFGEVWVVADRGASATGFDGTGALVMTAEDMNPERILVDVDLVDAPAGIEAGTFLGDVTGVLSYAFGNYRVLATQITDSAPPPGGEVALSIGVYNVENLDPKIEDPALVGNPDRDIDDDLGEGKFDAIARQIVDGAALPTPNSIRRPYCSAGSR